MVKFFPQLLSLLVWQLLELTVGAAHSVTLFRVHVLPAIELLVHLLAFFGWQITVILPAFVQTLLFLFRQALENFVAIAHHLLLILWQPLPPLLQITLA